MGPNIDNQEATAQPDLLEAFANTEVTIFGMTGTFRDLAEICPFDLNDPSVTIEAKNEFVVKAANEAGIEIKPEYESLFSQITEKHGLEKKFTVAAESAEAAVAEPKKLTESIAEPGKKPKVAMPRKIRGIYVREEQDEDEHTDKMTLPPLASVEQLQKRGTGKIALSKVIKRLPPNEQLVKRPSTLKPAPKAVSIKPPDFGAGPMEVVTEVFRPVNIFVEQPKKPMVVDSMVVAKEVVDDTKYGVVLEEIKPYSAPAETVSLPDEAQPTPLSETVANARVLFDLPNIWPDQIESEATSSEDEYVPPEYALYDDYERYDLLEHEQALEPLEIEYSAEPIYLYDDEEPWALDLVWAQELSKEPTELYENFATSLQEADEAQELPPIIAIVAGKMEVMELEQKEEIAPIIKDIVGAIHGIHLLEATGSDPEVMAVAEERLEELCVILFESLGIDYDDEVVKQFASILVRPDFTLTPLRDEQAVSLDLEYMGTREAKHFKRLSNRISGKLSDKAIHFEHALGMFVLLCIRAARKPVAGSLAAA